MLRSGKRTLQWMGAFGVALALGSPPAEANMHWAKHLIHHKAAVGGDSAAAFFQPSGAMVAYAPAAYSLVGSSVGTSCYSSSAAFGTAFVPAAATYVPATAYYAASPVYQVAAPVFGASQAAGACQGQGGTLADFGFGASGAFLGASGSPQEIAAVRQEFEVYRQARAASFAVASSAAQSAANNPRFKRLADAVGGANVLTEIGEYLRRFVGGGGLRNIALKLFESYLRGQLGPFSGLIDEFLKEIGGEGGTPPGVEPEVQPPPKEPVVPGALDELSIGTIRVQRLIVEATGEAPEPVDPDQARHEEVIKQLSDLKGSIDALVEELRKGKPGS